MKKVLLLGHTMARGGASHVLALLAEGLAEKGYEVELVFLRIRAEYQTNNCIKMRALFDPEAEPSKYECYKAIKKCIGNSDADIIISFLIEVNIIALLTNRGKKKIIISERNDPKVASNKIVFYASKILYGKADQIVFQSERVKKYYSDDIQKKSKIILNPIDLQVDQQGIQHSKNIVAVGKLYPQKNHKLLIQAFYEFSKINPEYKLHIYGEGPLREELTRIIHENDLVGKVILEGNRPDVQKQIKDAEMFVLSSDYEGLSNALLEALAIGIPSISTSCAGSDEIITDGENGFLVPVGDKQRLIEAMKLLASDGELRKLFQTNGKKIREKVMKENVINSWIDLIQDTIDRSERC